MEHILDAIACVEEYTRDTSKEKLVNDKLHLHATVYNIQIIGEAVYNLSLEFKQQHKDTPWHLIEKMRHILVHDYYRVNNDILWLVITEDIPQLKANIRRYLGMEALEQLAPVKYLTTEDIFGY